MPDLPARRTDDEVTIVPMTEAHFAEVAAIFEAGIATGHATFETEAPTWTAFDTTQIGRAHV